MADGMFDDLVPEQKPAAGAGMFDDLVPRAAVPNAPVAALGEPAPTAGRVDVGPIEVLGDDYAVPTVAGVPDYSGVFVDPEAQNDGLARIGLRALVGRAPELVASAIEAPATANEALSRAIGLEDSGLGLGLFDSMRGLLRRGASAVRELGYEGDMAQAGYGEPSVSGGDLVEALNPYANENRAAAAAEFGDGAGYDPLTLGERAARVATFVPETLLASAPDMAATLNPLSLGAYMASRGNEIAHARAAADNRSDVTLSDVAAGGVAAPIEATLERFTTGRLLPGGTGDVLGDGIAAALGRVGRETALQGGIGGVEEVVPYLAETLGTQTGSTPQGALESFVGGLVAEGGLGGTVQTVKEALGARRPSAQDAPPTDEPLVDIEPEAEGDAELDALIEQAIPAETLAAARAELGLEDDATPAEVARAAVSAIDLSGADVAPVLDRLQLDRALGDEAPVLDASRLPPLGETDSPAPAQSAQGAAPIQGSPNPTEQPAGALPTPSSPPAQAEPPTARPQVPGGEEATIGKLYRRGSGKSRSSAEAFRAPSGKWYTRHRSSGQWSDWQERDSFDPARIHGYRETTGRGGSVRIPGVGSFPVERGEAAAPAEPNPLLDLIVGAGGISREDARRMGVDPAEMNARVGVRPIFGRNGIALDSLRERLIEDGYLPPEPEDAPPSTDVNDVWELASRAIAGEPVYPMNDPRQIEAQMRAFEEQQGPEQSPEDARDEALALWYDEVGNETGEDIQPGDEAEVASIVDLVDRFGDDDMGFSAAPARDPFESEAEYAARLWEALEEQRGAYQEATQGGVRESLGGQEGRQAEPVQGAGDGFTFGQEPAAPAPEAREVAPTQGAGLFGAPSARDFVDAARRDRDARRDGLTGTGRTDMAAGDGELFAGPRPEQADIEPPPARPSRSTDGLESVEAPFYSAALRTPEQSAALGEEDAERLGLRGAVDDALAGAAVRVEFLRGLEGLPDRLRRGVERRLAERDGKGRTAALYDPVEKRVFIFTDVVTTADRAIWNAAHEIAGHHGLRELLGERLDRALEIALQNPTVQSVADAIAAERKIDTRSQSGRMLAAEEALAELAAAARTDNWAEIEGRYSTPVSETMRERVTRAIDNFIKRLKALMEDIFGRPNFSDADVRELLEAAWQAARQPVTEGRPSAALESSAQDQTQTPAFRAWFGDSKVVDENGEPLVVYHGTVSSFDEFSDDHRGKVTRATSSKAGFFFASSPRTAQSYADHGAIVTPVQELVSQAETAGNRGNWDEHDRLMSEAETLEAGLVGEGRARGQSLMPVYLSLQNPLEINAAGENPEGIGGINSLIAQAKRRGHDGVIIRNFDDAAGLYDDNADHFVAFYPEQIKSATGNRGTFDPERASILEAVEASDHRLPDRRGLSPAQSAGLRLAEDDVRRADRNPLEERGVIANARQDIADQIEEARQFAKGRPKNPQSLVRRANGARAYWTDAIVSRARSLTRRNPQSKALRELFNRVMNLEPGTDKVTGEILLEATARRYAAFTNRARNIIADTFGSDRLNERQNARLRKAMLTDGASGDAEADRAAKRLRKLMDTAKEDMIAAGIEVGEVEDIGYLTRLYDDAKILDDEAGFTAAATKLYRDHEFDKEIGRNGRAILYGDGTLPLFVNWAKRAGMGGDPIIKAGLSQLKTALRGYRSQSNVGGQNAEIIKIIDTLLPRVRQFYGETNADSWLHKIATPTAGQVFNGIGPSGAPVTKGRTLSGAADTVMADYLKTDMFDILDTYARVTSKKIAMAERFGPKGEKVDELIGAARREGVKKPDLDEAQELAESAMGNFSAVSERAKGTIDALQAWGTLTLLGRVAFASVAEPITFAMRTGQARHVIAPLTQVWRAVGDRKRGKELRDFAVMLGVNGNKAMEVVMQNQLGGDYGMTPRWAGLVGKFMEANLLSPLTRAQRAYGVGAANGFLRHVAQNVADGKRLGEMGVYLNELGIADHAAFSTWMLAQGGLPNPSELYDSDGRPTPRGQDYIVAVRRLIDQTIQNPNASHRPQWQNSPAGRVFGGIMGFSYAAYENVIKAELRRIKTIAKVEGVDAAAVRASKTATGALALIFGQTIVGTIREALFNPDRFEDKDDEELYPELMLLGLQRSFGLGSLDPVVQLYTGLKYQRSSAETILGAYIGTAAKTADRFLGVAGGQNSPNTDTAEYRAAESVYSSLITPVANALLSRVPLAGGPLIMASSSGQARRKFAGLFFDQPEPRTKLDDDYQAMQAEMTDLTQQVSEQLRLKPVDQWAEEFERLREEYPDLLAGASLEFYKRDGKYGRKGEPKRNAQGEPVIDLTGGDEAGGSVMGELQGYTGWRTRDGKREQYETEGIEDRITALNKAIRQVRGSDDLTYAGVFKVIRDVPSELPQTLELAREFDAGRPGALDTPEAQKVAPQSVRRTLLRELQEARQAEKRRALEVVERGRRGEAPSGDVDGRAPPRGIGRSSMPESRRAEYLGIGEGGRATPAPDVLAGAKNAPDLVMVGDWSGIESEAVRNALDSGAEGVYDPETRKAYVVNGLPEAHARFVAYHEIAGHHGLRGALGDEYESVLNRAMQNPTVSKIADEMGVDAYRGTYRLDRVEEALSELAAAARTGDYDRLEQTWGVEIPPSARRGVSGALRRMVQATKRTIGNLTGDEPDAFDDAQVYSLIEDAWQYVKDDPRDR